VIFNEETRKERIEHRWYRRLWRFIARRATTPEGGGR